MCGNLLLQQQRASTEAKINKFTPHYFVKPLFLWRKLASASKTSLSEGEGSLRSKAYYASLCADLSWSFMYLHSKHLSYVANAVSILIPSQTADWCSQKLRHESSELSIPVHTRITSSAFEIPVAQSRVGAVQLSDTLNFFFFTQFQSQGFFIYLLFAFLPILLKCNLNIALYKFKVYSIII